MRLFHASSAGAFSKECWITHESSIGSAYAKKSDRVRTLIGQYCFKLMKGFWELGWLLALWAVPVAQGQFTYTITNDTATITGYAGYPGPSGDMTIPDMIDGYPVTSIGTGAFHNCTGLTSVTFPNSVTNIGDSAFFNCAGMTNVTIGGGVTSLGTWAFGYCGSLANVTIPDSVSSIGDFSFYKCTSLTSVTIVGCGFSVIGNWAFGDCSNLANATIGNGVTSMGMYVFDNCTSLSSATIIGCGSTSIGDSAFHYCTNLSSVTIGNGVTGISYLAFGYCKGLTSLTIPESVTGIDAAAFSDCSNLSMYFKGNAPYVTNSTFYFYTKATVYYLPGTTGWSSTYGGLPTAPWVLPYPLILSSTVSFGVQSNGFRFRISWATNAPITVEACTNLAGHIWLPVVTTALTKGWTDFSDAAWTNYPSRFYRIRSP
jgi:hypothetical protein